MPRRRRHVGEENVSCLTSSSELLACLHSAFLHLGPTSGPRRRRLIRGEGQPYCHLTSRLPYGPSTCRTGPAACEERLLDLLAERRKIRDLPRTVAEAKVDTSSVPKERRARMLEKIVTAQDPVTVCVVVLDTPVVGLLPVGCDIEVRHRVLLVMTPA